MEPKRLNKFISDTGFCSRRDADELIEQGRVTVNGKLPTDPGMKVTPKDKVRIDDEILHVKQEKPVYLIFNKPANMSATSDMGVRDNVVRAINFPATLEPTAMLEREAEGIIFLSNEGDFVRNVKRADNKFEKEYSVTVDKPITADFLHKISGGGALVPGEERQNNAVSKESQTRFRIVLKPGTDHYLKRMCESLGYKVVHMQRSRFGEFSLAKLPSGHWRVLTQQEVNSLLTIAQGSGSTRKTGGSIYDREKSGEKTGARGGKGFGAGAGKNTAGKPGDFKARRGNEEAGKKSFGRNAGASGRPGGTYKGSGKPAAGKGTTSKSGGRNEAPRSAGKRPSAPKGGPKRGR